MSPGEDGLIGIPFPEHSSELLCHLNDQRRAGLLCDLTLTSRGMRYPTHRSVMAAVSLYFRRLFGADESVGGGIGEGLSVYQLDCVAPDALDALLEFAYTATLTIPSSGMRDVLQGAQLLGIQCVADACRDILGETTVTEETEEEQRRVPPPTGQHAERMSHVDGGRIAKSSRRKMDKKRMKGLGSHHHHLNSSVLNFPPSSPIHSQPSPASDSFMSLPSTQSPSPEPQQQQQEEQSHKLGQNGDPRGIAETLNGGPHWPYERPPLASASQDKLSEDDDLDGFVDNNNGMRTGGAPTPVSATGPGRAPSAGVAGRKRKSQTPQQCPVCQKIIHGAGKLPRHMRTHTGEKPFQCTACGVRFTRNDKLKIHMRKHTGERPYPCTHCPARFLHSYDLKNHLSLHSGARPFECTLCHKAFAREDHLQRHRKGHSCLEVRTRRPRRAPDPREDVMLEGGGREQPPTPLEALSMQVHPSMILPPGLLGAGGGPPLMFPGDVERQLHALAMGGYPELFLRGLGRRLGREAEGGDDLRETDSPASQRERWPDEGEEETGEEEAKEEE